MTKEHAWILFAVVAAAAIWWSLPFFKSTVTTSQGDGTAIGSTGSW